MDVMLMADSSSGITGAVSSVLDIVTSLFTFILANPLMLIFIGASLIPVGLGIFAAMKRASSSH